MVAVEEGSVGLSRPYDRRLRNKPQGVGTPDRLSLTGAFLWLALATTLLLISAVVTSLWGLR
jgi:hypothetical protein